MNKLIYFIGTMFLILINFSYTHANTEGSTTFPDKIITVMDIPAGTYSNSFSGGTLDVTITPTDATCELANGQATVSVSGGTGMINYSWSNSGSTALITGLLANTYSVTATDQTGCTGIGNVLINTSPAVVATTSTTEETCAAMDGTATVSVLSGTGMINYSWSTSGTTAMINNLSAGSYSVTATDANGCQDVNTATVNQNVVALSASVAVTNATCSANNGTAMVTVSGGTGAISYVWSNSGTTAAIMGLSPDTYSVISTDSRGCEGTASGVVGQDDITLSVSTTSTSSSGSDGTATATASGGTAAYTYNWDNGDTGDMITGLAPDTYVVTANDANGCIGTASAEVRTVLPVELISFYGSYKDNTVLLNWSTATESQNEGFYIEKSKSGSYNDWQEIDFVQGKGNSSQQQHYQLIDRSPIDAVSYYRLKQVDFDGGFEFSKTIVITAKKAETALIVFPNPVAAEAINLRFWSKEQSSAQVILTDQLGRTVILKEMIIDEGTNNLKMSIEKLPAGFYTIQLLIEKRTSVVQRLRIK